jgi:hypothetical protein
VIAGAFVAQGAVDDDEVGRRLNRKDLAGRGHADEETAARGKQLFRNKHRKCGADRVADDAVLPLPAAKDVELGVVTGPAGMTVSAFRSTEVPHDVAVRIKNADFGNGRRGQTLLATRFAQEVLRRESGRRVVVLVRNDRWLSCFTHGRIVIDCSTYLGTVI